MEILDADRLAEARATDERYAVAKLVAAAFNDPGRVWEEHERVRALLLTPDLVPPPEPEDWLARVAAIHQKMQRAGLVPTSGAVH